MNAYPNISYIASLLADSTRAVILDALMDGRALPAGELAYLARVTAQTASSHLAKLVEGNLLTVEHQGRHRYYRLANPQVAYLLETISTIAPPVQVRSLKQSDQLKQLRFARTCYDHLAGQVGVSISQALLERGYLTENEKEYELTASGHDWLKHMGLNVEEQRKKRRAFARKCLDWSERHHHISGSLGVSIASRFVELGWIAKLPGSRAVVLTDQGKEGLQRELGIRFWVE
ncbi:ArsR/SmtB family transcription factor [Brevibacillus sp. SYSU BS000544]|uniref:ArsR/SmtB family transcription factor n=1 Tax=Brevibacillus sp. SYSU BS000544 TaxID=3416443 RepID=UPI003CE460EE